MSENTRTKIFWRPDELELLAKEIDRLVLVVGGFSKMQALALAQESLPEDRRRTIVHWSTVAPRLDPVLQACREARQRAQAQTDQAQQQGNEAAAAAAATKHEEWLRTTTDLLAPLVAQLLGHPTVQAQLARALTSTLGALPATTASPSSDDAPAASETAGHGGGSLVKLQAPARTERPQLRRVLVAGLLPAQAEEVSQEFKGRLDLRFWGSNESHDLLRSAVRQCDVAIGMTDFMSHPADACMKSLAARYVRHSGGIKRLKDVLQGQTAIPLNAESV